MGHPTGKITNDNLTKNISVKVGGVAGLGSSLATAKISLEKLRFAPGEEVKVKFDMDNSKCKKPVKSFKVKLARKVSCLNGKSGTINMKPVIHATEYLDTCKYEG